MTNLLLIYLGKIFSKAVKALGLGGGSTWPGHVALRVNPNFSTQLLFKNNDIKKIVIAGTNGKTTTGKLLSTIFAKNGLSVAHNIEGANLINGLASTLLLNSGLDGHLHKDILIFESDENAFSKVVDVIKPDYIVLLNLFRDQMDRYGEIDTTAAKWKDALLKLKKNTEIFLNADDPAIAYMGQDLKQQVSYFGFESAKQTELEHGADSIYCPKCYAKLSYEFISFSHLGKWSCPNCGLKRPKISKLKLAETNLTGEYNKYNILAATMVAKSLGIQDSKIKNSLQSFTPAFGRQEELRYKDREIKIFLSKNPTSFNESLATIKKLNAQNILLVLNDRIPDGQDVSWIWDIDTSSLREMPNIIVSGDRVFDMALRLRYSDLSFDYERDFKAALEKAINFTNKNETLFILPTYSAMLELRKILKGRKLL